MLNQIQAVDDAVVQWVQGHQTKFLTQNFLNITAWGSTTTIVALMLFAVSVMLAFGYYRKVFFALFFIMLCLGTETLIKEGVHRHRPVVQHHIIPTPHTYSMPSGHASMSMCTFLVIAFSSGVMKRWYLVSWAVVLSLLVGMSRIYLCVHFLSDVMAGWGIGLVLGILFYLVMGNEQREKESTPSCCTFS